MVLSFDSVVQLTLGPLFRTYGVGPYACDQFIVGQSKEHFTVPHLLCPTESVSYVAHICSIQLLLRLPDMAMHIKLACEMKYAHALGARLTRSRSSKLLPLSSHHV